jgi:cellulose biosynthesis protein BcsQ
VPDDPSLPRRNYAIQTRLSPGTYECLGNKTLEEVRQYFNPQLQLIGYVFTMSEPTLNTTASLQILRQTYTEKVVRTVIPRNTDLRNAHFNKQTSSPTLPDQRQHSPMTN